MKILLFTDIPPTQSLTAGLVLERLCEFLPPSSIVCFAAMNPAIDAPMSPSMQGIPHFFADKPSETGATAFKSWPWLRHRWSQAVEFKRRLIEGRRLLKKAVKFGRLHKVDAVWAVLQGQTVITLSTPLAARLGVPLYTLVWDPFSWWALAHGLDPDTAARGHKAFDLALRRSTACAVASFAMARTYHQRYGTKCVPVISGHPPAWAKQPQPRLHSPDRVVLGMAGQFYASEEWRQLLVALDYAGWKIGGRDVFIRTMGGAPPPDSVPSGRAEFLGWLSQEVMIGELANCDILYCPYPFAGAMREVSQLSFPSKLVGYLAAGRPVVFHGPADSSPGRFLEERSAAICVGTPFASSIYNALDRLVTEPELYGDLAIRGQAVFEEHFTIDRMRRDFFSFLGMDPANGPPAPDASCEPAVIVDERVKRRSAINETAGELINPTQVANRPRVLQKVFSQIPAVARLHERIYELEQENAMLEYELATFYGFVSRLTLEGREESALRSAQFHDAPPAIATRELT